jgi:hypothetical protein
VCIAKITTTSGDTSEIKIISDYKDIFKMY